MNEYYLDPALIFEKCQEKADGFAKLLPLFPQGFNMKTVDPVLSGRMTFHIICFSPH